VSHGMRLEDRMKVAKWGNSLAIRIPKPVVKVLRFKEGDSVNITVADERKLEISKNLPAKNCWTAC